MATEAAEKPVFKGFNGHDSLPDKNGTEVSVGDPVRDDAGQLWFVKALNPRATYDERRKPTGELNTGYSAVDVVKYRRRDPFVVRFTGAIESQRTLPHIEKVELSDLERAELELSLAEIERDNINATLAEIERLERESESRVTRARRAVEKAHAAEIEVD